MIVSESELSMGPLYKPTSSACRDAQHGEIFILFLITVKILSLEFFLFGCILNVKCVFFCTKQNYKCTNSFSLRYKPYYNFGCPCFFGEYIVFTIVIPFFSLDILGWRWVQHDSLQCNSQGNIKTKSSDRKGILTCNICKYVFFSDPDECWFLMADLICPCIFQSFEHFLMSSYPSIYILKS